MRKICALAAAAFTAAALSASADAAGFWVSPVYSHSASADMDGFNDEVTTTTYGIVGGYGLFTLGYQVTDYDFDSYDPINKLHLLHADVHYDGEFSDGFGYFVGIGGSLGWEDDFHPSEAYTVRPRAGVSVRLNPDFSLMLGLKANFNEAENRFIPIVALKYRSLGDYGLSGVFGYPETRVMYRWADWIALEGSVSAFNQDVYQLSDDSALARKGYFVEDSFNAAAGFVVNPVEAITLRAGVNATFDRDFKIYSNDGDEIHKYSSDPSYGFYLNGSANF
ncbi:MAG: hypothetical protein SPL30_04670 [Succinivibrio sp.]|nr:hypothetical protein [Succinivibrio sp.]